MMELWLGADSSYEIVGIAPPSFMDPSTPIPPELQDDGPIDPGPFVDLDNVLMPVARKQEQTAFEIYKQQLFDGTVSEDQSCWGIVYSATFRQVNHQQLLMIVLYLLAAIYPFEPYPFENK